MSRFVSAAGTDVDPQPPVDDALWLKAQQQVEASRKPKPGKEAAQEGGKSLYEVLEANKAAKQDAFEEAARLKNQFRALDEDEVDFLDSVLELSRAKEDAVKQETAEQLEAFRKQRVAAEQALIEGHDTEAATTTAGSWTTKKKKRRRAKESDAGGDTSTKLRRLSTADGGTITGKSSAINIAAKSESQPEPKEANVDSLPPKVPLNPKPMLGLADYSSDEDD